MARDKRRPRLKAFSVNYIIFDVRPKRRIEYHKTLYATDKVDAINQLIEAEMPLVFITKIVRDRSKERKKFLLWEVREQIFWELCRYTDMFDSPKEDQKKNYETT